MSFFFIKLLLYYCIVLYCIVLDLVCWYIASKSGDVTEKTQSSLTDDVWDVEQAGSTTQNFVVGHKVVPADAHDASLGPYMERIQFIPAGLYEGPSLRAIE